MSAAGPIVARPAGAVPPPAPPDGLRDAEPADFRPTPTGRLRRRFVVGLVLGAALIARCAVIWSAEPPTLLAGLLVFSGWLAAVTARWICLRRDVPVVLTLAEARVEETDRGLLGLWRFASPVPERLARREMEPAWAASLIDGDRVAARLQESGFGTIAIVVGTPTADGWRLPRPRSKRPLAGRLYGLWAGAAYLTAGLLALAPSPIDEGTISAVRQQARTGGLGQEPWDVTVELAGESLALTIDHAELLGLLPEAGRLALATPGLLPAADREQLTAQYLPTGRTVRVRRTRLGPWRADVYVGPA